MTNTQDESEFSSNISFVDVLNWATWATTLSTTSKRQKFKILGLNVCTACQLVSGLRMKESGSNTKLINAITGFT